MTIKRTKTAHPAGRAKRRLRPAAPKVPRARSSDAGDTTSKPMRIGYARVSTVDQNLALQRDALSEAGCAKIFIEQLSGAVADRPALHDALEFARSGDTLIVWKLDRLSAVDEAVDRNCRKPATKRYRVSQPDGSARHNDRAGAAGFHQHSLGSLDVVVGEFWRATSGAAGTAGGGEARLGALADQTVNGRLRAPPSAGDRASPSSPVRPAATGAGSPITVTVQW
jgi:hypothetical protein